MADKLLVSDSTLRKIKLKPGVRSRTLAVSIGRQRRLRLIG